jgi:hypothetical protein
VGWLQEFVKPAHAGFSSFLGAGAVDRGVVGRGGIGRSMLHDAAVIGRWMIHDAAGIGRITTVRVG